MGEWVEQNRFTIAGVLAAVTVALLAVAWLLSSRPEPVLILTPAPTPTPPPTETPAPVRVYVSGAVAHPDVYHLPPGAIVKDAIEAAGGATGEADMARVNLALEVSDQAHVHVPCQGETSPPEDALSSSSEPVSTDGPININRATVQELETLPGIGPAIAERIVAYRTEYGPFASVAEITEVSGIGPTTLHKIEDRITVR